ncbi:MAG: cytochrome c [Actinomycetota bacterium]|nr:cytochrome c [Actinomycetota bacterium]
MRDRTTDGTSRADRQPWWVIVALAAAAALVVGCSGDDTDEPAASGAVGSGPGAELYAENCASCHGADLTGTDEGPSHLSVVYEPGHHPDDSFRSAIANGVRQHHWAFGDMPPVEGLSDDEVDEIIAFVRAQQEERGFEPYPPE